VIVSFPSANTQNSKVSALIPDLDERKAALDITTSCIVEAPAGSGKTGLLIQRYLKLLAEVDSPDEVLAITFTTKATAEMVERVTRALQNASAEPEPADAFQQLTWSLAKAVLERNQQRGWRLLERPQQFNIRTIDSLCAQIVRSVPVTSGETAASQPVNDARPLYQRAAHAVMMRFGSGDDVLNQAVHTVLMHRDGDLAFCERVLAEMLATRDQWGSLIPLGERLTEEHLENITLPRLNASLQRTIRKTFEDAREGFDDDVLADICRIAERHAFEPGYKDEPNPYTVFAGKQQIPECHEDDLQLWLALARLLLTAEDFRSGFNTNHVGVALEKKDRERLKEIIGEIRSKELYERLHGVRSFREVEYPQDQWRVTKALFRLLEHALIELKILFAQEEVCDFTEVALAARAALNAHEGNTQELLGTRLKHLLVDEMQDTSAGQYELLEQLTAAWDGSSQTVFLVGDPKQSIYLFRQARVDRFQQCMQQARLGDIPLQILALTTNFRSGSRIVSQFNETFRAIFPQDHPGDGDVVFQDATAANPEREGEGMAWRIEAVPTIADGTENRRNRRIAVRKEARATVELLKTAWKVWKAEKQLRMERGESKAFPFRAAVLTRARTHVIEIATELEEAGLPYRAVDLKPLAEQQEVLDLVSITRALHNPADRMAWLAVLRAPWCGIKLAHLHLLAAGDDATQAKQSLRMRMRERAMQLPDDAQKRVLRTFDVMDNALLHTGAESFANRVERTWRSLGGNLYLSSEAQENVAEYLRVLDAMEAKGEALTLASLKRRLDRLFARPAHAADAVDIMTIHRAKGLEWDTVIVPGLHRMPSRDAYSALEWLELPTRGEDGSGDVLLAPLPGKGGEPGELLNFIRSRKRARSYAEIKRLLYVAITRARTSLTLFASPELSQKGNVITRAGTLLQAAWPAAEEHTVIPIQPEQVDEADAFSESSAETTSVLQVAAVAEIIPFPVPAALEKPPVRLPDFERLPDAVDPLALLRAQRPTTTEAPQSFSRPAGTFGARGVGNAIHAFVERLSCEIERHIQAGESAHEAIDSFASLIGQWQPAIRTTLRAANLPPSVIERASDTVVRALHGMLASEEGRWILMPHRAATEEAAWRMGDAGEEIHVRLDRSFFAGANPMEPGDATFWIIDFKTGNRTGPNETEADKEKFLREERAKYEAQLNTYASVRRRSLPNGTPIRLGLFYPLMSRLLAWDYNEDAQHTASEIETSTPANTVSETQNANPEDTNRQFNLFG